MYWLSLSLIPLIIKEQLRNFQDYQAVLKRKHNSFKPHMKNREILILEELLRNLKPKNCLEWGSGYSTIYFPKFLIKDSKWLSIEHSAEWADRVKKSMLLAEQRRAINKLNDGEAEDYLGNKGDDVAWGSRIGINDHCMNLTLDMKRSMVLNRGSTQNLTWYLGTDMPSGGGGGSRYHVGPLPDAGDHHGPAYEEIYWAILS